MNLPDALKNSIEKEARSLTRNELIDVTQQLSQRYRNAEQHQGIVKSKERFIQTDKQRVAYILSRMPATFGALKYILNELRQNVECDFKSALDIGAGPGTVMWALSEVFPHISSFTMIEQDSSLIALGKRLAADTSNPLMKHAKWLHGDVLNEEKFPECDLVTVSYAMGEWSPGERLVLIEKLWKSTKGTLVIVEPGTMQGFQVIRTLREKLIQFGAYMVAPCPHANACPMPSNDWCHFSTRIERSSLHRHAKEGTLGYEDEKFSYIIVSRNKVTLPEARILRHPQKKSGHVIFELCTADQGIQRKTVSRKEGNLYKKARDSEWGDRFPEKDPI